MAGTSSSPPTAQGRADELKKKGFRIGGNLLNHGFIGVDTYMRVKDGESLPVAAGKAVLTNAAFSLLPGGMAGAVALMAVTAAPEIMNMMDSAAGNLNAKKQQFGGNFQQSEPQMYMMQQGLNNMQNARMHTTRTMALSFTPSLVNDIYLSINIVKPDNKMSGCLN